MNATNEIVERACAKLGVDARDLQWLGNGLFGSAWKTRDATVVKVTSDPSEIALVRLGTSHESRGLPVIFRAPVTVGPGIHAYEREDLSNFPFECPLLQELTIVAKPKAPMHPKARLAHYDAILYGKEAYEAYPFVIEALRRFRRHGILVWDLKRSNLGHRGDDIVIRDGRCIRLGAQDR